MIIDWKLSLRKSKNGSKSEIKHTFIFLFWKKKDHCTLPGIPNAIYETCTVGDIMAIGQSCAFFCTCGHSFSDENVRFIECTEVGITADITNLCQGETYKLVMFLSVNNIKVYFIKTKVTWPKRLIVFMNATQHINCETTIEWTQNTFYHILK